MKLVRSGEPNEKPRTRRGQPVDAKARATRAGAVVTSTPNQRLSAIAAAIRRLAKLRGVTKQGAETTEYKFVYDAWNRLVKVTDSAGTTTIAEYRYDGEGRRIARLVPNGDDWDRTDYYYDEAWQCLEQRYGEGQAKETVPDTPNVQWLWDIRYIDAPVLRWRSVSGTLDEVLYVCNDANMNVTALVNTSGTVVERYVYDPYGKATCLDLNWANGQATSRVGSEILYCGYRFDPETGLDHVRHRYYHPTLGRWTQRDPREYTELANLYSYVDDNPTASVDPSGLRLFSYRPSPDALQGQRQNLDRLEYELLNAFWQMCPCALYGVRDGYLNITVFSGSQGRVTNPPVYSYFAEARDDTEDTFCCCVRDHYRGCKMVHDLLQDQTKTLITSGYREPPMYDPKRGASTGSPVGGQQAGFLQDFDEISWDPNYGGNEVTASGQPPERYRNQNAVAVLGHEMMHAVDRHSRSTQTISRQAAEERAMWIQNKVFEEMTGKPGQRKQYGKAAPYNSWVPRPPGGGFSMEECKKWWEELRSPGWGLP